MILGACAATPLSMSDPYYEEKKQCLEWEKYKPRSYKETFGESYKSSSWDNCVASEKRRTLDKLEAKRIKKALEKERRRKNELNNIRRLEALSIATASLKKTCGADYDTLRLGIRLNRLTQCWPKFQKYRLSGQVRRTDGILSVYEIRYLYSEICYMSWGRCIVYVLNGQVVGWQ